MRFITMHPNVQTKSSDTSTTDLYPIYSPTSPSSSPVEKSSYQRHALSRRRKVVSESLSNDLFLKRSLRHLSPDSVMHARMFTMPEEGTSSADEEHDLPSSTRSMGPGYLLLSAKDRLKSASLEWTLSNGSVTPRAMHYHTHPPLDFKSLKEKLEQLTGSPDDANKKHFVSGLDCRRKGVSTTLPASSRAVTNPAGGQSGVDAGRKTDLQVLDTTAAGRKDFFQNVPYVTVEPMSRTISEEVDSKPITMKAQVSMKSMNQPESRDDSDILDGLHWSDLARYVAQKDGRLQMILKRHCQELKDLKQQHEVQWEELRHRISKSVAEDSSQRNETQLQSEQLSRNKDGNDNRSLLSSGFDDFKPESPGVFDRKQPTGHSSAINAVAAQPDFGLSRSDAVAGGNTWTDNVQRVDGVYGIPQQLSTLVQHQMAAATSNANRQRQMENQTSHQTEKHHTWSDLVNRTPSQWKIPPVPQQVEPLNWYQQQLDMLHGMQAAGSLEQRRMLRQLILQQVSLLETQNQPVNIRCHRFPNHQCYCARPCDVTPLYNQEYSHSVGPYSAINWNDGSPGISYTPNYAQGIPFPQPSSMYQHSPCNEVSSYYYPENLALSSKRQQNLCCSPDQMVCLLDTAKNHLLPAASPVLITTPPPTPMPLFSHLRQPLSRQTSMEGSYPPSLLRPSSSLGLPLFSPLNVFQFPYDVRQLFYPLNPFAT